MIDLTGETPPIPARYLDAEDRASLAPVHVVWEITLACDLKCSHCGSRAGKVRPRELTTDECLDLVRQLARLGTREVTLIGGEAYLRKDWVEIIREITDNGMQCTMQSGGLHLDEKRVREAAAAGLKGAGISIDGLEELHDRLRGVKGSYEAGFRALRLLKEHGIPTGVNSQITSETIPQLPEMMDRFIEAGAKGWQVQLTVAMGRAADHPELLLQPYELLNLMPLLADLYKEGVRRGFLIQPGNNIGYFGPYESVWRGSGDDRIHWVSCNAGQNTMGIESDGTIKGCPSLPTSPYSGGNVRDLSVKDIWQTAPELSFTRKRTVDDLWGFCRTCYYADVCRAGCSWTTHVLFGKPGNNPYCHHRTLELEKRGLRERIVRVEAAPGTPFDYGLFELVLEQADGSPYRPQGDIEQSRTPLAITDRSTSNLVQLSSKVTAKRKKREPKAKFAAVPTMVLCRGCKQYVARRTEVCPHCQGDVKALAREYEKKLRAARKASERLMELLQF